MSPTRLPDANATRNAVFHDNSLSERADRSEKLGPESQSRTIDISQVGLIRLTGGRILSTPAKKR